MQFIFPLATRRISLPRVGSFFPATVALLLCFSFINAVAVGPDDVQIGPDDPKELRKQAERLLRLGRPADAEVVLRRLLVLDPTNSDTKLELAHSLLKQRRILDAYDIALKVGEAEPKHAKALALLGNILLAAGRFNDASQLLYAALKEDRREASAWAGFGLLEFYNNNLAESLENLREAVYFDRKNPDYIFSLAQVSARAEKFREAADAYSSFLRVSRNMDDQRRARIRGLINFLRFLGNRGSLYTAGGPDAVTVPFELTGNRPVIEVRLNDHPEPFRFVLDTGSGISVISDETAKRLSLRPVTKGGYAKAIGGKGQFEIVYGFLRNVAVGDIKLRNVPVYIRKFHNPNIEIDGYIGISLISQFLTTVDYGERTFRLVRHDAKNMPARDGITVPLRLTTSGFLSGEVQLEGVDSPLNFIVDTGASVSVISDQVANHEIVTSFLRKERFRVIGAAGVTENVPTYLLPKVSFGSESILSLTAIALDLDMINEVAGFEQSGILGGNFLRNYKMTFDFKNSNVSFSPIEHQH